MDEIWSLELVRGLHSALGVFTQTHHDNNHYLNSLFIYFFGQRGNWAGYRIPSIIAGIGTVVLAWFIGRRQSKATAFFSTVLTGFSYVMILYSSEARGYAPMIFFCYLCFLILQSFLERPRWKAACLFSIGAVLGFTAHLTFFIFCSASLIWLCTRLVRRRLSPSQIFRWIAACYAAPLLYLLALYFVDVRHMQIGGGTPISVLNGYRATLAWSLGGPNLAWLQLLTATICVLGLIVGLAILVRDRNDEWVFFVAAIVVIPLALPFFEHGTLHYVRYFSVALAFLLIVLARVLGWLYQRGNAQKIVSGGFCLLFVALNAWDVHWLFKNGRGHTAEAVRFMAEHSNQGQVVTFGGEQDFRIQFVLAFYWREMMDGKPVAYYDHEHWPADGPEWVIFHKESFTLPVPPGKRFTDKFGNWFELVRTFPTAPLSGVHWFIYHKIPAPVSS